MPRVYMSDETRAFKWNVEKLSSKQCAHHPYVSCNCSYKPTAGVILIQYATFPAGAQTIVAVSNPIQHLQFFEMFKDLKRLLGHILRYLPLLGSCENIDECAEELAYDLSRQFGCSRRKDTVVFLLNLEVHKVSENCFDDSFLKIAENREWTLKNGEDIEEYLTRRCPLIRAEEPKGMEEVVEDFVEIAKVDDEDDQNSKINARSEVEQCPILILVLLFMFTLFMFELPLLMLYTWNKC